MQFFRVGDFYETFGEDARIASKELGIALTRRGGRGGGGRSRESRGNRIESSGGIPMAGIPHHAAEHHIRRLIERGYKVAICRSGNMRRKEERKDREMR